MKKLFLIIGAPGSGKTTDAKEVSDKNATISHYSTGDMLRAEAQKGSKRGNIIKQRIDNGELVPVDIAAETIISAIELSQTPVVLVDGYPRSVEQMQALEIFLEKSDTVKLQSVIEIVVSDTTAKERVVGRSRGIDDDEKVFIHRMDVYKKPLNEILDFYKKKNLLHKIDGEGNIESVVADMEQFILKEIEK